MGVTYKLSDEEKKRASRFLEIIQEQKEIDNKTSANQNVKLPIANNKSIQVQLPMKNNINLPSYRQNTTNVLPTIRLATDEEKKLKQKIINKSSAVDKIGYVAKKGLTGLASGTAGIAQASLTDIANNLEKGNSKSGTEVLTNLLESTSGILNPVQTYNKYMKNLPNMIGNVFKTINNKDTNAIEKVASLGTTAVSDALSNNVARDVLNSGVQLAGKVLPSDASEKMLEINKKISEPIEKINEDLYIEGQNYDKATQFIGDATQSVGNMVPAIATTAITKNPNIGLLTMGVSAKGQSTQEAMNRGATLDEAIKIGDTKGAIEVATEMLTGGVNIFGKGALDDIVEKGIKDKIKSKVGKYLLQKGYQLGGEVLEETISDVLGTVIDKGTVDPNATYSIEDWGDTAVTTILSTIILNSITGGIGRVKNYNNYDYNTQQRLQEAQDIINNVNNQNNVLNTNNNTQTQQITPQENKMAQNGLSEQIKADSNNFSKQVDEVINGTFPKNDMLVLGKTPQALKDIGLSDLPITMTQKHLETIMNESGKYKNANYHNLGIDIVKQLPEAINNPLDIVKSNTDSNSIVLTTYLSDKQDRTIIASIKIDGRGTVNDIRIDTNVMTSAYGRNNYEKFMEDNLKNGNLLYDIDRGVIKKLTGQGYNYLDASVNENTVARLQLPRNSISNINNSIPFSKENVNNTTINNYSMQNEQKNTQTQQVTPIQDKMAHNGLSTELNTILNNKQLPMQNYQYEKSENIKIDNLRKEASRYFNNSQQTNNFVNMLEKIIADKNVEIRLDSNLMTTDDKVANGLYSNGVITINPNSNRVGEFITIHELTHAIGTKQMASMIENYKNSNLEFESSIQDLLKNYNINEINEEALADISGQLFGNQEFINDMAKNTPNIFQKIYSEIKYLWHQFRGYKNQNQFLEDLYYKWTQAYNSNNKLNNSSYYSIQTDNNGNRYVKVDTDQYIFDGIDKKDYNKIAKMYMQDYLMGKTTLSNNDSAVIDSRSTNKYTNPRQRTSYMNEKMQLTPELKNVLEIAQKDSMSLPTKENSKYKSWEYYKFNFELGGRNFEGTINIGIDKEGNKHFYEINKIRFTGISSVSTNSQHKTDFINNSILPTNKNVNSTTKYSIQESENNSKWKDYLEKNFKPTGSRTNLQDIKLPTKEYFKNRTIKNGQKSTQNIQQEQLNNNVNTQNQQGTPIQNKVAQNGLSEQINNSVANNQETLYNNIESESGINEGIYSRTTGRDGRIENEIANQRRQTNDTRISKDNISKDFKESRQRSYEEFIDYANKNKIEVDTVETTRIKELANNLGIDVTLFNGDGSSDYIGMTNKQNPNNVYIDINQKEIRGEDMLYHEFLHSRKRNNDSIYIDRIAPIEQDIVQNYTDIIDNFIEEKGLDKRYTNCPELIAEEIIADYTSKHLGEFDIDYNLPQFYIETINQSVDEMLDNIKNGNLLYDIDRGVIKKLTGQGYNYLDASVNENTVARLQLPRNSISNINNSIPFTKENVNRNTTINNYSMQNEQKNTQEKKYRTQEQISKDKTISDLDAIKEASQQLNKPSLKSTEHKENQLKEKGLDKSPTIDYIKRKRSKEKVSVKEVIDTLNQKFINKGHYIDKLANKTGNKKLTYLYDRTMNTFNEAQISIGEYQINSKGEKVGKSIIDIFQPSIDAGLELEFEDYLLNKHNISRYTYEKGIYGKEISAIDSADIVLKYEERYPQFKEWAKDVNDYNENNLKDLVANGMINQSTYDKLKEMYGNYVPTYRDIVENMSNYEDNIVGSNPIKKATQSDKEILSIKESMAEQTLMQKKAIRMNNLGLELYNTIGKNNTILEGIEVDPLAIQTITGDVIEKATDGSNIFTIFKDGEMIQFKISDELYTAFSKDTLQNKISNSKVAKAILTPIEKVTKVQRELLTTYSIGFSIINPIKDFGNALFTTKYSMPRFLKNYTKALYNMASKGEWYQSYKNNGGMANTYFDYEKGILPTKNRKFGDKVKKINNIMEQAPRLAEYISTIEKEGDIDKALFQASDITVNFKRGGDITKAVNKYGFNFLNASVQGLDKIYRDITNQNGWKGYARLITKATVLQIAPTIINSLVLGDDEEYQDLPEYIKDDYYLFKMGNGKFFRVPKDRFSAVIGGIARRSLETAQGKEVDWKSVIDTVINQLAPNSLKNSFVGAPIIQAVKNEAWYGGDIVSSRLQKLPIVEQYDETTDEFSKWLGATLNISPKKINYVLDQYSGGIGDIILPMMTPQAENNILEDKFTVDPIMKNKNVSEYYNQLEDLQKKNNSINATDEDKLRYKYFSDSSSDISKLYQEKRKIQNLDIFDKEKKEKVREVQKQINDIVKEKLEKVNDLKVDGITAKIDGTEYYKAINLKDGLQEWKRISDEEAEKNKNISLKTYANYKEKVAQETIKQRKSGKIKENSSIKNKDKIKILLTSNYSDSEREAIYKEYINSEDKKIQLVDKLGIPLNQYLKYKQQDFENDKDADGETISGTKKQKVYDYLNSIPDKELSVIYKNMICKLENINDYNSDIAKYIIDKNITPKDKKELLKILGFKVDKNGNVQNITILPITKNIN